MPLKSGWPKLYAFSWWGYLAGMGLIALATWLKYLMQPDIIPSAVPIPYYLAVVPTAIFFGLGPAILVCILSIIVFDFFFIPPLYTLDVLRVGQTPTLLIFLVIGVIISVLTANLRQKREEAQQEIAAREQSEAELAKYRSHLEDLIRQRTAELEKANLGLTEEVCRRTVAEYTAKEEKDKLAALINSITDEIWFADTKNNFTLANPAALREFGYDSTEPIEVEKLLKSLVVFNADRTPRPPEEAPLLRALRGETIRNHDEIILTPAHGEARCRQVSAAPVKDTRGNIIGSVSVVRDVTEQKKLEQSLQESEERYRSLVELAPDAVLVHYGRQLLYANPAALKLYGAHSFEELAAQSILDLVHADDREQAEKRIQRAQRGETLLLDESRTRRLDGQEWVMEGTGGPVNWQGNRVVQIILRDITARKKVEEELSRHRHHLE